MCLIETFLLIFACMSEVWGLSVEDWHHLKCGTAYLCRQALVFWRIMLPDLQPYWTQQVRPKLHYLSTKPCCIESDCDMVKVNVKSSEHIVFERVWLRICHLPFAEFITQENVFCEVNVNNPNGICHIVFCKFYYKTRCIFR